MKNKKGNENEKEKEAKFEEEFKKMGEEIAKDPTSMGHTVVSIYLGAVYEFLTERTEKELEELKKDPELILRDDRYKDVDGRVKDMFMLLIQATKTMALIHRDIAALGEMLNIKINDRQKEKIYALSTIELVSAVISQISDMVSIKTDIISMPVEKKDKFNNIYS